MEVESTQATNAKFPTSFRLKTTLTLFVVFLLLAVSGLTFMLVSQLLNGLTTTVWNDLGWKARRGAREVAQAADVGMALEDESLILTAMGEYRYSPDVLGIVAVNKKGKVLARYGRRADNEATLFTGPEDQVQPRPDYFLAWASTNMEGQTVGRVALLISTRRLTEGKDLRRRILLLTALGCVAALIMSLFFVNFYIGPLLRFTEQMLLRLRHLNANLERRVEERTTELQATNYQLKDSLVQLHSAQRQLIDASRRAGMADVATTVLHNVGNVLNSVNVSANLLVESVRTSRSHGLGKAVALMKEHESDLAAFLTSHEKGKRLPAYLAALAEGLATEQSSVVAELESLQKNIDHIKVIVSRQQAQAKNTVGVIETLNLGEMLDEAIKFNIASYDKHGLEIVRQYEPDIIIRGDRHKLYQIVMNLLANARHALRPKTDAEAGTLHEGDLRRVTVKIARRPENRVMIAVSDTGCGIAQENMGKIFSYGFTTKIEGHGFGLHSSACAAVELGGNLSVASPGANQGATFTLELPVDPPRSTTKLNLPAVSELQAQAKVSSG